MKILFALVLLCSTWNTTAQNMNRAVIECYSPGSARVKLTIQDVTYVVNVHCGEVV